MFNPQLPTLRRSEAWAKRVILPMERVFVNVDRYGNTGAASVYVALEEAIAAGRLKRGDLVLLVAFGGGFPSGAALLRWGPRPRGGAGGIRGVRGARHPLPWVRPPRG